MNDWTQHPRYREIKLDTGGSLCPGNLEGTLSIVLFAQDAELRGHAVKHMLNLEEYEAVWKSYLALDDSAVIQAIAGLQKIGCPGLTLGLSRPPCKGCGLFSTCSGIVSIIESEYLKSLEAIISEGGRIPRYACYPSDLDGYEVFCLMPDRPVVIKASRISEAHFNLMTGYSGVKISFGEMRHIQVEKMLTQARRKNIEFCLEDSWGMENKTAEDLDGRRAGSGKKKKKKRKSKKVHWRKYLEMLDESEI